MDNFCNLYMNSSKTDFTIVIQNTKIPANKDVLALQSRYFEAMFRHTDLWENRSNIVILDCDIQSFVFVMKLLYGCPVSTDSWSLKSLEQLISMLVIINRFFFSCDIEEQVTQQFVARLGLFDAEPDDPEYKDKAHHNFSLLLETYQLANRYHFQCLTNKCYQYFDEHSSEFLVYLEKKCKYSSDLIRQIIERQTFGVEEMKIFNFIKKQIQKNGFDETKPLLRAIRLQEFNSSEFFEVFGSDIWKGRNGSLALTYLKNYPRNIHSASRVCHEIERKFTTREIVRGKAFLSRCLSARLIEDLSVTHNELDSIYKTTVTLAMPTRINHIMLTMCPRPDWWSSYRYSKLAYFFRIVLIGCDGRKTKLRWFIIPALEYNEYYFDAKPVAQIEIYCDKDVVIESLSYEMTKNLKDSQFLCEYHNFDGHKCAWNS